MTIFKVINTLKIDDNTSIIIEGKGETLKSGIGVLDSNGKPYEVLSVGMSTGLSVEKLHSTTALLIKGDFNSDRIFV